MKSWTGPVPRRPWWRRNGRLSSAGRPLAVVPAATTSHGPCTGRPGGAPRDAPVVGGAPRALVCFDKYSAVLDARQRALPAGGPWLRAGGASPTRAHASSHRTAWRVPARTRTPPPTRGRRGLSVQGVDAPRVRAMKAWTGPVPRRPWWRRNGRPSPSAGPWWPHRRRLHHTGLVERRGAHSRQCRMQASPKWSCRESNPGPATPLLGLYVRRYSDDFGPRCSETKQLRGPSRLQCSDQPDDGG
jgi:hypothetical protein